MDRRYPFLPSQTERATVYIPLAQPYHELFTELDRSILVFGPRIHMEDGPLQVQTYLIEQYGGSLSSYPFFRISPTAILLTLPPNLNKGQVIDNTMVFQVRERIVLTPWSSEYSVFDIPKTYRVQVRLLNFPFPLWKTEYVQRVLATMGEVMDIDDFYLTSNNRRYITAWITCPDPLRIPTYVDIHYGPSWSECQVQVLSWMDNGYVHPMARGGGPHTGHGPGNGGEPDEGDDSAARRSLKQGHDQLQAFLLTADHSPQSSSRTSGGCSDHLGATGSHTPGLRTICNIWGEKGKDKGDSTGHSKDWTQDRTSGMQEKEGGLANAHEGDVGMRCGKLLLTSPPNVHQPRPQGLDKPLQATTNHGLYGNSRQTRDISSPVNDKVERSYGRCPELEGSSGTVTEWTRPLGACDKVRIGSFIIYPSVFIGSLSFTFSETPRDISGGEVLVDSWQQEGEPDKGVPPSQKVLGHTLLTCAAKQMPKEHRATQLGVYKKGILPKHYINPPNLLSPRHSILGPPPLFLNLQIMASSSEDELSQLFQSLQPLMEGGPPTLDLPIQATTERNWDLAVLAKVVTTRPVIDNQFGVTMLKVWGKHPDTRISPIGGNTFLIDFVAKNDMLEVLNRQPWTYRQDLIAMTKVSKQSDLNEEFVDKVEIWTQLHNIPPECISETGLRLVAERLGLLTSDVLSASMGGRQYSRVRVAYPIDQPLNDHLSVTHPVIGELKIHLHYERVNRVCEYCAHIGHGIADCEKYAQLMRLNADPAYKDRPELALLKEKRRAPWITAQDKIPRASRIQFEVNEEMNGPSKVRQRSPGGNTASANTGPDGPSYQAPPAFQKPTPPSNYLLLTDDFETIPSKRLRAASPKSPPRPI